MLYHGLYILCGVLSVQYDWYYINSVSFVILFVVLQVIKPGFKNVQKFFMVDSLKRVAKICSAACFYLCKHDGVFVFCHDVNLCKTRVSVVFCQNFITQLLKKIACNILAQSASNFVGMVTGHKFSPFLQRVWAFFLSLLLDIKFHSCQNIW